MNRNPKVYLDTSALFSGIWSDKGGARLVLKLGEVGVVRLLVGSLVLTEIETVIRSKAPDLLGVLALVLDRSNIQVVRSTSPETLQRILTFLQNTGDAHVLAVAWDNEVDYFVTLDRKHFIGNEMLRDAVPFVMGTPGDFLSWYRTRLF
jgi:predicted nucleic acid-binding protein